MPEPGPDGLPVDTAEERAAYQMGLETGRFEAADEIERLRAALREIAGGLHQIITPQEIARAALGDHHG